MQLIKIILSTLLLSKVISDVIVLIMDYDKLSFDKSISSDVLIYKLNDEELENTDDFEEKEEININLENNLTYLENVLMLLVQSKADMLTFSNIKIVHHPTIFFNIEDELIDFYKSVKFEDKKTRNLDLEYIKNIKLDLYDTNVHEIIDIYIKMIINMLLEGRAWYCYDKQNTKLDSNICEAKLNKVKHQLKNEIYKNVLLNANLDVYSELDLEYQFKKLIKDANTIKQTYNELSSKYDEDSLIQSIKNYY